MLITGFVITATDATAARDLARHLESFPALTLGACEGTRIPVVSELEGRRATSALFDHLGEDARVAHVDVVSVDASMEMPWEMA